MKDRGLSPMVATIVLIAMVMVIAGILAAGITGSNPKRPRESGVSVEGIGPESTELTLHMQSGKTYLDSYYLEADLENVGDNFYVDNIDVEWNNLELRIAGELAGGDVAKVTEDGSAIPLDNDSIYEGWENTTAKTGRLSASFVTDNLDFHVGDIFQVDDISPSMDDGDEVVVIWGPNDQTLFTEEV